MRHEPKVGEHLYTYTPCSAYYVRMVRKPWTVVEVKGNICTVQAAKPVFLGAVYYDTLPDYIQEDTTGRLLKLRWNEKHQRWQETPAGSYPRVAVFGEWDYQPYLD